MWGDAQWAPGPGKHIGTPGLNEFFTLFWQGPLPPPTLHPPPPTQCGPTRRGEFEGMFLHSPLLQVQRSQSIVVVGGGSAGVEMAAEIKTEYPDKEVCARPWR